MLLNGRQTKRTWSTQRTWDTIVVKKRRKPGLFLVSRSISGSQRVGLLDNSTQEIIVIYYYVLLLCYTQIGSTIDTENLYQLSFVDYLGL